MNSSLCPICHHPKKPIFTQKILKKYDVTYFCCSECGFIQTETPYWLDESYTNAITSLDIGLINRNLNFSQALEAVIYRYFDCHRRFLDFAGGYGMFTRMMRDKGFDFYHQDKHCQNLFAQHFEINDLKPSQQRFELVTAFEVLEHIPDPIAELDYIFSLTDNLIFSTVLIPPNESLQKWWYLGTDHGQHISFYTTKSFEKIAQKYHKNYFYSGELHAFTTHKTNIFDTTSPLSETLLYQLTGRHHQEKLPSLTQSDFEYIKKTLP